MSADLGVCIVMRSFDGNLMRDRLDVERADPRVWVGTQVLQEIARGEDRWSSLNGDVLTIKADNRTVVYRVDWNSYDHARDAYIAEWPD